MNAIDRFFDVRGTERRPVWTTFLALLLIVVAHTVLETVRDALFLRHVGVSGLGVMYIVTAVLTFAVGSVAAGMSDKLGVRRGLVMVQLAAAVGAAIFYFLPPTRAVLMAMYAFSAVCGALLVPQLWVFVSALLHAGQSRRLFGTIALAGVFGAVLGSSAAAALLLVLPVESLLLLSSLAFAASAYAIRFSPRARARFPKNESQQPVSLHVFKSEPLLLRLAAVVALGSITTLLVDYFFKATVTSRVAPEDLGSFFARYYALMNGLALIVQLVVVRRLLARAGVIGTVGMLPSMLMVGSAASLLSGGALLPVLFAKAFDSTFRHSVYRTGTELVYLALPTAARNRAKPLIDGAVVRGSQAAGAGLLLLLGWLGWASVPHIALATAGAAALWGALTYSLQQPYLELFRRTLTGNRVDVDPNQSELDLETVEVLVEALSSQRPREVIAAISALQRRARVGLIPALVLLHDDEEVIERALEIFATSTRKDWLHFAERHASDRRERVQRAALRALARARAGSPTSGAGELGVAERPWVQGYLVVREIESQRLEPHALSQLVDGVHADAREARLGALVALGDAEPSLALADLFTELVETAPAPPTTEEVETIARTAAKVGDKRVLWWLTLRLTQRQGRSAVRTALAAMGEVAYEYLAQKLADESAERRLRIHLPRTLSRFGTQAATDLLFHHLQHDADGLVRYKCLRGLGNLVVGRGTRIASSGLRPIALRDLTEYFRLLGLRRAIERGEGQPDPSSSAGRTLTLLRELLSEKQRQALERVFRLLKLSFPHEDIHRVHTAVLSGEASDRANAAEFLDALLAPRRRSPPTHDLRPLLRVLTEELPDDDAVARARALAPIAVPAPADVLTALVDERDVTVASLAAVLASKSSLPSVVEAGSKAAARRPSIAESIDILLAEPRQLGDAHG
jgi:ATP:ADP antiporter, AAA family